MEYFLFALSCTLSQKEKNQVDHLSVWKEQRQRECKESKKYPPHRLTKKEWRRGHVMPKTFPTHPLTHPSSTSLYSMNMYLTVLILFIEAAYKL